MGIQASEKQRVKGICLGLLLLVVIVYAQAAGHDFVTYDDGDYVYANPQVLNGLTVEGVRWAFTTWHAGNWHPLTWLSLMLDAQIYGAGPFGFHFTNVLLHAANVLLLFAALWRMTRALWPAALAAALFAVHPLHVESVAWVSERKDVLSTTFWMLCLLTYAAAARGGGRARWALTAVFMALGLMAKPMLVTLPFALLLLDIWPLRRFPRDRLAGLLLEKTPLFGLSAASCTLTVIAQSQAGAIRTLDGVPFEARLANAVVSYAGYLGNWSGRRTWHSSIPILISCSSRSNGLPSLVPACCWRSSLCWRCG